MPRWRPQVKARTELLEHTFCTPAVDSGTLKRYPKRGPTAPRSFPIGPRTLAGEKYTSSQRPSADNFFSLSTLSSKEHHNEISRIFLDYVLALVFFESVRI